MEPASVLNSAARGPHAAPGPASDPMALREDCGRFEAAYAAVLEAGRDSAAVFSGRLSRRSSFRGHCCSVLLHAGISHAASLDRIPLHFGI